MPVQVRRKGSIFRVIKDALEKSEIFFPDLKKKNHHCHLHTLPSRAQVEMEVSDTLGLNSTEEEITLC